MRPFTVTMTKRTLSQFSGGVDLGNLPNTRVPLPPQRHCGFCNCASSDPDPVDVTQPLRWAYRDGSGNSCFYCERVWQVKEAHKHASRSEYQRECQTNKAMLDHQISGTSTSRI